MTCKDLEPFSAKMGRLSPEAKQHVQSCARCQRVWSILDAPLPPAPAVPPERLMAVEQSILTDLRPVAPLSSSGILTVLLIVAALAIVSVGAWVKGVAGWHALSTLQAAVLYPCLAVGLLLFATLTSLQVSPGARLPVSPRWAIAALAGVLLLAVVALFPFARSEHFASAGVHCWMSGSAFAMVTAPLLYWILRRGFPLAPAWLGATAGLLAGLVGLTVLEIYCPYLDRAHIGVWHLGAAVVPALAGALLLGLQHRASLSRPATV